MNHFIFYTTPYLSWNFITTDIHLFTLIENFLGPDGQWDTAGGNVDCLPWQFHFCPNGCGRKYKRSCHLKRHLKYECGVSRQFSCIICMKEFSRRSTLKTHVAMVHGILMKNITPREQLESYSFTVFCFVFDFILFVPLYRNKNLL